MGSFAISVGDFFYPKPVRKRDGAHHCGARRVSKKVKKIAQKKSAQEASNLIRSLKNTKTALIITVFPLV